MKKHNNINTSALEKFIGYTLEPEPMDLEIKPEIQLHNLPRVTFDSIKESLKLK
jgi:hypothetical protein